MVGGALRWDYLHFLFVVKYQNNLIRLLVKLTSYNELKKAEKYGLKREVEGSQEADKCF